MTAPLWVRQASALVWLRATIGKRRLLGERGLGRAVLSLLGLSMGALGTVSLSALILGAARDLQRDPAELQRRGGPLAVFATWLGMALVGRLWFSIRSLGGGGPFLDPRRFLPYAVPARVVSSINFIAALLEPTWLFFYAPLIAIALGVSRLPGAPPAWALLAAEMLTAVAVAGVLHLFGALGSALESRPAFQRAVMILLAFAGFAAFQLAAARPGRVGLATLFAQRRWEIVALTPPGWAAVLARALGDGSVLHSFTPLLLLGSIGGGAALLAHRVSLREARKPQEQQRSARGAVPYAGWVLPFGPPTLGALVEKELKTLLRTGWLQLVIVPAGFLLLRTAFTGPGQGRGASQIIIAAAYAHLAVLEFATNTFGRDLGAARAWFLWPVDRRLLFAAKNACAYLFSLCVFLLLVGVQAAAGALRPGQVALGLLAHAASFPVLAAFGNVASVLWPLPLRAALGRGRIRGAAPVAVRLSPMFLFGMVAWLPSVAARVLSLPPLAAYASATAASLIAYGGLLALSAGLLDSRREPFLMALAKDE